MLLNGQLIHGSDAMAGEFGHVTLDEDGPPCSCGKRGCWEQYASNSAAVRYYQGLLGGAAAPAEPSASAATLKFTDILRLADDGDAYAIETLERMARYLGIGIAPLVTGLAPQVVVVIGEITAAWDLVGPIVLDVVKRRTLSSNTTQIVPTDLATQPRLRGAVTLVVQQHFGAPNVA